MKKNINDLICGLLNDGKFTRKELDFIIYQAEQDKINKTTLLDGIMEEYLSFVVENGGVTWKVKSNIRLLSKVFNITYDKLLFELESNINSYITQEKKKGKTFVNGFKREYNALVKIRDKAEDEYYATLPSYRTQKIRQRLAGFGLVKEKTNLKEEKKYDAAASDLDNFLEQVNPQTPGEISELLLFFYANSNKYNFNTIRDRVILQVKAEHPNNILLRDVVLGVQFKRFTDKAKLVITTLGGLILLFVIAFIYDYFMGKIDQIF